MRPDRATNGVINHEHDLFSGSEWVPAERPQGEVVSVAGNRPGRALAAFWQPCPGGERLSRIARGYHANPAFGRYAPAPSGTAEPGARAGQPDGHADFE